MTTFSEALRLAAEREAEGHAHDARVIAIAACLGLDTESPKLRDVIVRLVYAVMPALRERIRQQTELAWSAEHDAKEHDRGELGQAAAALLLSPVFGYRQVLASSLNPHLLNLVADEVGFEIHRRYDDDAPPEDVSAEAVRNRLWDVDRAIALALAERQRLSNACEWLEGEGA